MSNFILLPKPYLNRANLLERKVIDQKINTELKRIRKIIGIHTQVQATEMDRIHNALKTNEIGIQVTTAIMNDKEMLRPKDPSLSDQKKNLSQTLNISKLAVANKLTISDFISNIPNGNFSIGYICPLTFVSKLDYQRIWGSNISTFVWYFVPQDANGNYLVDNNGIFLGYYSKDKNVLTTEETVKWHWDYDLYNKLNYPIVKFKIAVKRSDNGMPGGITLSDEIIVSFNNSPCININSMDISASSSNGGYPSIKGGDHGTEPTLNLYLNAPAPPTGQIVNLSITGAGNTNPAAWINNGNEQVIISGGQTHGQWSGIIGSRHVLTTKNIHVVANVNGIEGVSPLRITRN